MTPSNPFRKGEGGGEGQIDMRVWQIFVRQLLPRINVQDAELMFMMLDISGNGHLGVCCPHPHPRPNCNVKLIYCAGIHEFMKLNDLIKLYRENPDTVHVPQEDERASEAIQGLRVIVASSLFEAIPPNINSPTPNPLFSFHKDGLGGGHYTGWW